jgi:hypothetical protein
MGYVNAPQGRNPWISEPETPQPRARIAPPMYHTSRGNFYRPGPGNPENDAGRAIADIAMYNARYVQEWVKPRITGKLKAEGEGPQPPDLQRQMGGSPPGSPSPEQPALGSGRPRLGTLRNPDGSLLALPEHASPGNLPGRPVPGPLAIGPGGNPGRAGGSQGPQGIPMPPGAPLESDVRTNFGKRLAKQSRVQARNAQTEGPSLLGALPVIGDRVGPSAKRRGPAGMDPRRRGTWLNYE